MSSLLGRQKLKYHEGSNFSSARFNCFKPSTVARTMLIGGLKSSGWGGWSKHTCQFDDGNEQHHHSNSEPSTAGLSNTFAPPNSERTVWEGCTNHWNLIVFFASSTALRIASGTLSFTSTENQHDRCGHQLLQELQTKTTSTFTNFSNTLTATKRSSVQLHCL